MSIYHPHPNLPPSRGKGLLGGCSGLLPNKSRAFHAESSTSYEPGTGDVSRLAANATAHGLHGYEGQQGKVTGPLDGRTQSPLVLGADATLPAGLNLGPVGDKTAQPLVVLVVNVLDVFHAEGTDSPAGGVASPGTTAGPGSASGARPTGLEAAGPGAWSGTGSGARACRSGRSLSGRGWRRG